MVKLIPGSKHCANGFSRLCHTTRAMRFTNVTRSSKCMQILHEMIKQPGMLTQSEIKQNVYKRNMGKSCQGFFSALHHFGLATFVRDGHKCKWLPTLEGILFYSNLPR